MRLCDETITVFNAQYNPTTDRDDYTGTVISGASWFSDIATSVIESGLKTANKVTIRIPENASFSGKTYVDPSTYKTADTCKSFTLQSGDIIVKGAVSITGMTPSELQKAHTECVTVVGVTDNRRAPNAPHWRVVGV